MDLNLLGTIAWWKQAFAVFFIIVCIVLIVIVLLQKGKGGGLSAAFGGAGGQSAFGSKTGDVFTWATIVVVGVFLLTAMLLTVHYKPEDPDREFGLTAPPQQQSQQNATQQTAAPTAADAAGQIDQEQVDQAAGAVDDDVQVPVGPANDSDGGGETEN